MYLEELGPNRVFYRQYGDNVKVVKLQPIDQDSYKAHFKFRFKFDELDTEFNPLVVEEWTTTELVYCDLEDVWHEVENEELLNRLLGVIECEYMDVDWSFSDLTPVDDVENIVVVDQQFYIPSTLEDAVEYLVSLFKEANKSPEDLGWHMSGGMALRNSWGLWYNETPIAQWFTDRGIYHGDDRSSIIGKAVIAKIKGESFDLDSEIKYFQTWWENTYGEQYSVENMKKSFFEDNKKD